MKKNEKKGTAKPTNKNETKKKHEDLHARD